MNRSTCAVSTELRHAQNFRDNSLAGKCCISVDQDRKGCIFSFNILHILLCTHNSLKNRVDRFKVRRVSGEIDLCCGARRGSKCSFSTEVILHIASAVDFIICIMAFKLLEDLAIRLSSDICENIEATAVRHSDADFIKTTFSSARDNRIEHWNQRLSAFE